MRTHCNKGHELTEENIYYNNGYRKCKECQRLIGGMDKRKKYEKEYRKRNRNKILSKLKEYHFKARYNLTTEQHKELVKNGCGVCGTKTSKKFCADHNHESGKFRGILCSKCNVGLGQFSDDPLMLAFAIKYLVTKGEDYAISGSNVEVQEREIEVRQWSYC